MAFGGGGPNDFSIKVRIDEQGAIEYFNKLDGSIKRTTDTAANTGSAFSKFGASLITINQGAQLAASAISTIGSTIGAIPNVIQSASRIDDIFSSFETAAQKAGTFGDVLSNQLSTAVDGTVSKIDLLDNANQLMQAGLKPDQIVTLTEATRSFADVLGTDTKGALDQVTDSLLRGNDRALKTLGITVDNEAAAQAYAKATGLVASKLTEAQKVEATRAAVIDALAKKQKELGKATLDSGDAIDRIGVIFTDFATDALHAVGSNKALAKALNDVADALKTIDFNSLIDGITILIAKIAEGTAAFAKFIGEIVNAIKIVNKFTDIVDSIPGAPIDQILGTKDAAAAALFGTVIENIGNKLVDAATGSDAFSDSLKKQKEALSEGRKELEQTLKNYPGDFKGKVNEVNTDISTDLSDKLETKVTEPFAFDFGKRVINENAKIADDLQKKLEDTAEKYTDFFTGLFSEFAETGSIDFKKRLEKAGIEFVGGFAGEMVAKLGGGFLENLLDPSSIGKSLADALTGGLTSALTDKGGPLGSLIDSLGLGSLFGGLFAKGGIFDGDRVTKAARGMVVSRPTNFLHGGGIGLMGEAGPEAILPLTRVNGVLGVRATGFNSEATQINETLAGIPNQKQIDLTLNVKAIYEPGTRAILDAAGINLSAYSRSGDTPGLSSDFRRMAR